MKIALVGPGIISIPPVGWGAVEILIWDYYNELTSLGHAVDIINIIRENTNDSNANTKYSNDLIQVINQGKYDFVHLHYDVLYHILPFLTCPKVAITSHYPYIDQPNKHRQDGYHIIFDFLVKQNKFYHFVLADKDIQTFIKCGANPIWIKKISNGIDSKLFHFSERALLDKTIYLGKITPRKNQYKYQTIPTIDFVGENGDYQFRVNRSNYLGEWDREKIHTNLTQYSNLLLISEGEADPLVVKEALMAGLGIVVNKTSAENLDPTIDFITIIEDNKINDLDYIQQKLEENKRISLTKRKEIREYGITNFDISNQVKNYVECFF
jgi:hypothetical protein